MLTATVILTTRNRRDELRHALRSVVSQSVPSEVLVLDDGSSDGTSAMVRAEFPGVVLHRFEESRGLIMRRNEGARRAQGAILFSIDDDAIFSSARVIEQTLAEFDSPEIGAIALPLLEPDGHEIEIRKTAAESTLSPMPEQTSIQVETFIGTAYAVRRELFLQLGGFEEALVHQGEEPDFAIRLLAAGFQIRAGRADAVIHYVSAQRDARRMDYYGCRNAILFAWQNVPARVLPFYLAATTLNCLRWSLAPHRFWVRLHGVCAGYAAFRSFRRRPVAWAIYREWRRLRQARIRAGR